MPKTMSEYADDYIAHKRAGGVEAYKENMILRRFIRITLEKHPNATTVTQENAEYWSNLTPNESPRNQQLRTGVVQRFSEYLLSRGVASYIYPRTKTVPTQFTPYIFTNDELARIFAASDNCRSPYLPTRCEVASLIFRVLYSTGMRISEAINLKVRNIDLVQGVIGVYDTKFGKERLLPVDDSLLKRMKSYSKNVLTFAGPDSPFFPGQNNRHYHPNTIYGMFREFLWQAGISHGGKGAGPRVHDLRHTFAVHCLRRAVKNGDDLGVMLKYLSVYLGHSSTSATQAYLRLTADMYPDVVCKVEYNFDVLPDLEVLHEAN